MIRRKAYRHCYNVSEIQALIVMKVIKLNDIIALPSYAASLSIWHNTVSCTCHPTQLNIPYTASDNRGY